MPFNTHKPRKIDHREDSLALKEFIAQVYWGQFILPRNAHNNLKEGLLELRVNHNGGLYGSNGLLVTDNGYFLTAHHCLDGFLQGDAIDNNGNVHKIEKVCAVSIKKDMALAKAEFNGDSAPRRYKIFNTNNLSNRIPMKLLAKKNGKLIEHYGFVESSSAVICLQNGVSHNGHLILSLKSDVGNSGGILVSLDGGLVGFVSAGEKERSYTSAFKIIAGLELVDFYARSLDSR